MGYAFSRLGQLDYVFAVAPQHPLAALPEPLPKDEIRQHRAVVVRDTSRVNAPQSLNLLEEQDTLTVFGFDAKLQAQLAGLGCGYLPRALAEPYLNSGELVAKRVESERCNDIAYFGWRKAPAAWRPSGGASGCSVTRMTVRLTQRRSKGAR